MNKLEKLILGIAAVSSIALGGIYCANTRPYRPGPNPLSPEVQEVQNDSRGEFGKGSDLEREEQRNKYNERGTDYKVEFGEEIEPDKEE